MEVTTPIYVPRWAIALYIILSVVSIPWIFNLAENLPTRHLVRHWDAVWVGFDAFIFVVLLLTVYFALKKLVWAALSATALATLLVVDAWFDILTARPGHQQRISILFGLSEVVLAGLTFKIIYHMIKRSTKNQGNLRLVTKRTPPSRV